GRLRAPGISATRSWRALVRIQITLPGFARRLEFKSLSAIEKLKCRKRQLVGQHLFPGSFGERRRKFLMIKCRSAIARTGLHQDIFLRAPLQIVPVPEASIVIEPVGRDLGFIDASIRTETAAALLGVDSVGGGEGFLGGQGGSRTEAPSTKHQAPE